MIEALLVYSLNDQNMYRLNSRRLMFDGSLYFQNAKDRFPGNIVIKYYETDLHSSSLNYTKFLQMLENAIESESDEFICPKNSFVFLFGNC